MRKAIKYYNGYEINEEVPNHSTYSQNYARKFAGSNIAEKIFNDFTEAENDKQK